MPKEGKAKTEAGRKGGGRGKKGKGDTGASPLTVADKKEDVLHEGTKLFYLNQISVGK